MNLTTKRLIIRPAILDDLDAMHRILSDEQTMRFFVEGPHDKTMVKSMLEGNEEDPEHYAIILQDTGAIIGKLSFAPWFMKKTYEIGWIIDKEHTGKGYMTEAAEAMLEYGFNTKELHRIIATCQPQNLPSKRICEKLNMRLEGTFQRCIHVHDDTWWDELFYAILREEYKTE
mgnify:CR=1 FL=1